MGSEFYVDKSDQTIKNDVKKQFDKDDRIGMRDDQEIYKAGMKVIDTYLAQIRQSKENYGPRALEAFVKLKSEFDTEQKKMTSIALFTQNKAKINEIGSRIDNAEKVVIDRLLMNRATRTNTNALEAGKKMGKEYFTMTNNVLTLTKAVNTPTIHEVLGKVFADKNAIYQIDYSRCTNPTIKQKMTTLTGGSMTCMISYDAIKQTYLLRDSHGTTISNRALIWEGVTLTPESALAYKARTVESQLKNDRNNAIAKESVIDGTLDQIVNGPLWKQLPAGLRSVLMEQGRIDISIVKTFLTKTEQRIDELIRNAKAQNYELQNPESVSKKRVGSGLMEVHLISDTAKADWTIWKSPTHLSNKKVYDIIDSNEGDYAKYFTQRIQEKRNKYDHLTKKEILVKGEKNVGGILSEKLVQSHTYALENFKKMLNIMIAKEGNSIMGSDDINYRKILKHIENSLYTLKNTEMTPAQFTSSIVLPIQNNMVFLHSGAMMTSWAESQCALLFSGDQAKVREALRNIGQKSTAMGMNTNTSFLENDMASQDIEISKSDINTCFKNIGEKLTIQQEDPDIATKKTLIDSLYAAADAKSIVALLVKNGMLPDAYQNNKDVIDQCIKLQKQLNENKTMADKMPYSTDSLAADQLAQKVALEANVNKTERDLVKLQALTYLVEHPSEQKKINAQTLTMMKDAARYDNVAALMKATLAPAFVEIGGGAVGKNAKDYNDIVGYGMFNLSDKNAEFVADITQEVLITVAVCIVTAGVGGVVLQAGIRGLSGAARFFRANSAAIKLMRFAKIGEKTFVVANRTERLAKLGYQTSALLIEAPVFNSVNTAIHNAIAGREISADIELSSLNPFARENIKTAAFLGGLQIGGAIAGKLSVNFGQAFTMFKNSSEGVKALSKFSASTVTEFGTMMAAEQAVNLTFGREVQDPDTGEIRIERGLHAPSGQEVIQMLAIILGMRATSKYHIWPKIEKKIATGDLVVIGVKNTDMIVADKNNKKYSLMDILTGKKGVDIVKTSKTAKSETKEGTTNDYEVIRKEYEVAQTEYDRAREELQKIQNAEPGKYSGEEGMLAREKFKRARERLKIAKAKYDKIKNDIPQASKNQQAQAVTVTPEKSLVASAENITTENKKMIELTGETMVSQEGIFIAEGLVDNIDAISTPQDAVSRAEKLGYIIGKHIVGPTVEFLRNAREWLKKLGSKRKNNTAVENAITEAESQIQAKEKVIQQIEAAKNIQELSKAVEPGIDGYTGGQGYETTSGDKRFIESKELQIAFENGDFESLNFQKGDAMLSLRAKGVELYIVEKIQSVEDMIRFVTNNPRLFGGEMSKNSFLAELQKAGKSDIYKLTEFNKKLQKNPKISGSSSKTGFDMKKIVNDKVTELTKSLENIRTFPVGVDVIFPRTKGGESVGKVVEYIPQIDQYKVMRTENGQLMAKRVFGSQLKIASSETITSTVDINELYRNANEQLASRCTTVEALRTELLDPKNTTKYGDANVPLTGKELYSRIQDYAQGKISEKYIPKELRQVVENIVRKNNGNNNEASSQEYNKDFEQFLKNKEDISSSDYKSFLESQFGGKESVVDIEKKVAYHVIGLAQMRRISSNALGDYRWGEADVQLFAQFMKDKIGSQIETPILKQHLDTLADGKMLDYKDMKDIGGNVFNNTKKRESIGSLFLESFGTSRSNKNTRIEQELSNDDVNVLIKPTSAVNVSPEVVLQNAKLSDAQRLLVAEKIIGTSLTAIQKKAILDAHAVGRERGAQVYEYTPTEIKQKITILKEAGVLQSSIKELLKNGVCGEYHELMFDVLPKDEYKIFSPLTETTSLVIELAGTDHIQLRPEYDGRGQITGYQMLQGDLIVDTLGLSTMGTIGRGGNTGGFFGPYVSKEHLDYWIDSKGKISLVDKSTNGTKIATVGKLSNSSDYNMIILEAEPTNIGEKYINSDIDLAIQQTIRESASDNTGLEPDYIDL